MSKKSKQRRTPGRPPPAAHGPPRRPEIFHTDQSPEEVLKTFERIVAASSTIEIDGIRCRAVLGPTRPEEGGGSSTPLHLRAVDPAQQRRLDRILDDNPPPETCPACRGTVRRLGSTKTGRLVFTCSACGHDMGDPTREDGW